MQPSPGNPPNRRRKNKRSLFLLTVGLGIVFLLRTSPLGRPADNGPLPTERSFASFGNLLGADLPEETQDWIALKLESSVVPRQEDAMKIVINRWSGILANKKFVVAGLICLGIDDSRIGHKGDLIWMVRRYSTDRFDFPVQTLLGEYLVNCNGRFATCQFGKCETDLR